MTIIELKDQIVKNNLSNFYVFVGVEIGIINIYLEQMSNKLGLPITRADSVSSIYSRCMGGSLFGDNTGFYVIRNDTDFQKQEKVFDTIEKDIGKNVIVLLYEKIDSRLKFGKAFKDKIVQFEKLSPQVLKSYIKREISLNDKNIETLMSLCSGSYDMCMLEIDKIKQFRVSSKDLAGSTYSADYSFNYLLNSGVIYQPQEVDVFNFTDAVCNRNKEKAFYLETVLRDQNISSVVILGTLYSSMKSVMLIQCCEDTNIAMVTGLDNRQIYFNKKYVGKYNTEELVNGVKFIIKVIDDIKAGRIDDVYATRYVLSMIL